MEYRSSRFLPDYGIRIAHRLPMITTTNSSAPSLEVRKTFFFDIDGTLVDSNSAHTLSWQAAFESVLGKHYPYARVRRAIGMPGKALIALISGVQENSPEGQKISRAHSEIFLKKYLANIKTFPQSRDLIQALRTSGVKTAVTTSMKRGEMEKVLHQVGLLGSFDLAVSSEDAEEDTSKRNTIKCALDKFQLSPKDAYLVADTPYDIEAAASVSVDTIALRCGGWDDEGLARAFRIFDDPSDLLHAVQSFIETKNAA